MKKFWQILGVLCLMLALAAGAAAATYEPIEVELPIQIQVAGHEYEGKKYFIPLLTHFELELSASVDTPKPEGAEISSDNETWSCTNSENIWWQVLNGNEFSNKKSFGKIIFDKPGQYVYTLQQKADSSKAYVEYDTATHTIEIDVKDEEGQLNCSAFYDGEEIKGSEACVIHNKYVAGDLVVSCQAEEASNGVTFPVTVKLPAVEKYMSRFAYAVKHLDGTSESVKPDTDSVTAQLAHGETLTIMGVPSAIKFEVTSEYLALHETPQIGYITADETTKKEIHLSKDTLSVTLESKLFLYGTEYSYDGSNRYDYPGRSIPVTVTLCAKDSDAPLPLGSASGIYEKTATFAANSQHGTNYARMGTLKLANIVFEAEDLGQADERSFTYYISHGEDSQKTPLTFLSYNIDTKTPTEKQVDVTITIKRDESGKLSANVQYAKDAYSFPDKGKDSTAKARFADRYLSTSVSMEYFNTGENSRPNDTASLSLRLLDETGQPMRDWDFNTNTKRSETSAGKIAVKKPDKTDRISFELSDRGKAVVYGIPCGAKYCIEKIDGGSSTQEYIAVQVSGKTTEKAEIEGVIKADGEANGRIICKVVDPFFNLKAFSAITLPTKTTAIMKGALSGTAAEAYVLPEKIETIEKDAFEDLPNARFIVIPENAQTPDRSLFPADVLLIRPDGTPVE